MKRVKRAPAEAKKKISEQDEINRLKRQIAELQEENDVLKSFNVFRPRNDRSVPVRLETPTTTRRKGPVSPSEHLALRLLRLGEPQARQTGC